MSTDTSANRTWQTLSTQADSMATLNQLFSQQSNRGSQYRVAARHDHGFLVNKKLMKLSSII